MRGYGDVDAEMHGLPFDQSTADAFLSGRVAPDDAPPGFQDVATLIQAARPPASAGETAIEGQVVAAFALAVRMPTGVSKTAYGTKRTMLAQLLTVKMAAAAAAVFLGGTATAAATGSLPAPVQSTVASGLSHAGISIPNPDSHLSPHSASVAGNGSGHANATAGNANATAGSAHSGSTAAAGAFGLCTAYAAASGGSGTNSNANGAQDSFSKLMAAAQAKGETIQQYCANATPPSTVPNNPGSTHVPTHQGSPAGTPTGAPSDTEPGLPSSVPSGPSGSNPSGPPTNVTPGPPSSTPSGPQVSVPSRAPSGTNSGPPTSAPAFGSTHSPSTRVR